MVQEVDQTSVDVIKTILESSNGKAFFLQYLKDNLRFNINTSHGQIQIMFNEQVVASSFLRLETKLY